jgi:predicted ester cyclase
VSTIENKAFARRLVQEVFHGNDLSRIDPWFTPDIVAHDPGVTYQGRERLRQGIAHFRSAFPDLRITIDDLLAEGDRVVLRYTGRGSHQGEFRGIAPTGKPFTYTGILIWRFVDGQVAEHWAQPDLLGLFQQLGVIQSLG